MNIDAMIAESEAALKGLNAVSAPAATKPSLIRRTIADPAISLLKGAIAVPEAAVGIADLATMGYAGKLAEKAGFRPKEAKATLDTLYSPEQQQMNREVADTGGFFPTIAAAVKRPSVIAHSVLESAPGMLASGGVARGALKLAPKAMKAIAGEFAPVVAGAAGEGVFGAGSAAEQIRQETEGGVLTPKQAGLAAASGLATSAFGLAGGAFARKLGIADVDTMLANGKLAGQSKTGAIKGIAGGMLSEGVFEEMPQSAQEQVMQNLALGRPWDERVAESAAMGGLAGAAMGGGGQVLSHAANVLQKPGQPVPESNITAVPPGGDTAAGEVVPDASPAAPAAPEPLAPGGDIAGTSIVTDSNPPPKPAGAMVNALAAGGISMPVTGDMYSSFAAAPFANAPDAGQPVPAAGKRVAGLLESVQPETELETAKAWAIQQIQAGGNGHLMQGNRMNDTSYGNYLVSEYRKAQEKANGTANILPDMQDQGPGQVDGARLAVPALQGTPVGNGSNNTSSGGITDGMSSVQQKTVETQEVSPVRSQVVVDRVAALKQEKTQLLSDNRGKGIAGGLIHSPEVTQRLGEINAEIRQQTQAEEYRKIATATPGGFPTPLDAQAHNAATSPANDTPHPTQAQIEAGNYKKGHVNVRGLDISIENPAGSIRKGTDENGKAWETKLAHHYGYIKGTIGKDKDHIDVFIGTQPDSDKVYVVDQIDPATGKLDEHKVMLGFDSVKAARTGYLANYDKSGSKRIGSITESSVADFKQWLKNGNTKKKFAGKPSITAKPANSRRQLDSSTDSLPVAVAKLGGISRAEIDKQTGTGKDLTHALNKLAMREAKAGWMYVIRPDGMPLDQMREALVEQGYLNQDSDINDLLDKLDSASRGTVHRSSHFVDAGADAYREAEIRYSEMINAMTDGEYEEFSRNQWLDEQVQELADASDILDEYLDSLDNETMTAADWQAIENDFREALNETEVNAKPDGEVKRQEQPPAAEKTEGIPGDVPGNAQVEDTQTSRKTVATEKQNKLFATPSTFGKKPQPKTAKGDVSTSDLLDGFTATESVQPELKERSPAYGSNNTLVTAGRAAEIRKKLKAKFDNQINSGIDPEMLSLGTELAIFHIEAGVRKFSAFVTAISQDLDVPVHRLREYLRGWYNGARDTIEDKGLSIEGMDDSAEVREAHKALFEEKQVVAQPARSPQRKSKHRENLEKMLAAAKTEQGKANWKKRLESLDKKEAEQPPVEALPENWQQQDNKPEATFKKGARIQTNDGEHGVISDVYSYTMTSALLDIQRGGIGITERKNEYRHQYTAKLDNGVEKSLYRFQPETDAAPEVVPAPVYKGKPIDPENLLTGIKNSKDNAANKRAAASRAKKASSIKEQTDAANAYAKAAVDQQAAFDAWALQYPAEAIKYQKPTEIVAVPSAAESTGVEKTPAGKLQMDIKETVHTKKEHKLFIVKMYDRVERDEYDKLNRDAKRTGNGWDKWSKGFQFLDRESAENFVEKWGKGKPTPAPTAKGLKISYADFMTNVYHTLEENGFLSVQAAANNKDNFRIVYKRAYEKAVLDEFETAHDRGDDVAEAYTAAISNDISDLSDKFFDRARAKKYETTELTANQQKTIRDLGPVGTKVQFKQGFNDTVYEIDSIEPNYGNVHLKGDHKSVTRTASEFKRADSSLVTPASNAIIVNEKTPTQGVTDGTVRGNGGNTSPVGKSGRAEPAQPERKPERNDAGDSGIFQPTGIRSGAADERGDREGKTVATGRAGTQEHGDNVRQGDSVKRLDGIFKVAPVNFRITDEHGIGKGGAKQKARDNINAIRTLKKITAEERPATPEEQAVLVKYVDWGMGELANNIFEQTGPWNTTKGFKEGWEELGRELKELLTAEEYAAAKKSTVSAFYTPIPIYRAIYDAAAQLGFTGGKMLTPGSGLLHEAGTLPDAFLKNSRITGVELNPISAAISKLLYPGHDIRHQGFEKFVMPDNFYDMAIGNPPFVDLDVTSDPAYAKHKFKLHDYFFAKSIDKVRPGGLLIFITSKGTMDKANDKARAYLAERADLLGAIRLPETAFKENAGTETVTDVIFLRKRLANEQPGGHPWGELKEVKTSGGPVHINEYFAKHTSMVLGTNAITSSQHGPKYTVMPLNGTPLAEQFDFVVRNYLPEKVYSENRADSPADRDTVEFDLAPSSIKEGAFYLNDKGEVLSKESGVGVPVTKNGKDMEVVRSFIPLRDAVRQVLYVQIKGGDLAAAQKDLKRKYDAFVKKHGFINSEKRIVTVRGDKESISVRYPNFSPFRDDPDSYLVASIEKYDDETGKATPTGIFTERTIKPEVIPQINSITDAMHVVMHEDGRIDIAKIAAHMNVTEEQAIDALGGAIYRNPQTMQWETNDEYLSGNVKQKLALAEATAQADPSFTRNVEALTAVQPEDLPPSRMSIGLGEPIVKPLHVEQFAKEIVNMGIRVSHLKNTGDWGVEKVSGYQTTEATSDWGTNRRDAAELIDAALNSRQIRIESYAMNADGKEVKVFDKDATNAANEKLVKLKEKFSQWVWEHPERSQELSSAYNTAYNNSVKRVYGGDHISKMAFPGMSSIINPFEHQKRVAWRVVQSGNTYMAHSVGAGKTIGSILAGMELKRLGIKKKPCWVVPNHMLKQFASEFLQLYPAAKIIVADETQFSKENRNRFMGRVAAENWDGVIITHSAFGKMQVSPDFSSGFIQDQIDELEWELSSTDKSDRMKRKQIERAKLRLEQRLEKVLSAADKDKGVTFEETGIDQLFVDEAHEFRKLDFVTNQTNIKGIDPNGSLMSFDLYVKSRYLEKLYPGRSLVLMSGTAITNTIGEIYTIQRFLQEDKLKELGLDNFDAWASTFGDMVTKLEATPASGYKPVTRFAKFKKLSSLSQLWSEVGDFIHAKDLTYIKRPAVMSGGRILVTGEQSDAQKAWKKSAALRIKAIEKRKGSPKKGDDILLSVITDGRHVALDERYVPGVSRASKDNKLEKMTGKVAEIWQDTKKDKLTQMIFVDLGTPGSEERRGFSAYNQIVKSLVAQGIPEKEIAIMQNYKKSDEKIKLFKAMNEGTVRVLIGSSEAMGTGVNAQKKLVALHHLDPDTYLPSNIEQREGRIVRQGNSNEEIQLYAYVTKGSYDETMWQFLETKQRFIDQFLSGEAAEDEATDIDGGADSFAMARAMSSDNPLILERAGIESDIQRLESLRRAHFDDQQRLKVNMSRAEGNLPHYRKKATALEKVIARRTDTAGDKFSLTLGAATYDERKKAGEALGKAIDKMLLAGHEQDWRKIGELAGLDIMARGGVALKMPWVSLEVGATGTYSSPISFQGLESTSDIDHVGVVMKLENMARSFDRILKDVLEQTAKDEKLLKDSSARIGRAFEHAETLADKQKRLAEIETILRTEERQAETPDEQNSEDVARSIGEAQFKLTGSLSTGMQATEAQVWVDTLPIAAHVNVVQSVDDLPATARAQITLAQVNPAWVHAMELDGTIHVIADNVPDLRRVKALVIGHELAHAGQTKKVVDLAVDWFKRTKDGKTEQAREAHIQLERIADLYGYDLADEKQYRRAVQEATAAIAERVADGTLKPVGLMQRLFMYIKHWLRQNGLISHVSDSELSMAVAEMLRIGEKRLSVGKGGSEAQFAVRTSEDVKANFALLDQAISQHAASINAPAKVADMVKSLIELAGQSLPPRLKANIGKIMSNPWFGSEGKPIRRHVVNLNLERSQNRNGIISDLFQESEGYAGVEGLDNILKGATKEEIKLFNGLIKYGDRNDIGQNFTRDELYRGKTPFGKVPDRVVKAYKAFQQVMQAANRVRFQQLDELSLLPYKDQDWYSDLIELLNRNGERAAGLNQVEAGEFHRLIRSLKRGLTDEELASGENPAKVKASPAVIAAYHDFWRQVDQTDKKHQGNMLSAFRDILGYRGEIDKLKNEWGNLKGYAPRNRKDGDWHVSVYTINSEGERVKVYMKPTLTEAGAKGLVKEVQSGLEKHLKSNFDANATYEVEYERNEATPSELLAWKGSEVAVEALLNQAFDRAGVTGKMSVEQWQSLKHEVFQQIAKEIMAQGFGRHGISREATLIEGYDDTDYQTVLKEYISGMAGWLSKMRFAIETTGAAKDISKADPTDKVWVNDYVQDAMKNSTYMDELAATARSVGAVYYLGFKVSSAMLNAFQNYTVGQAELTRIMKKAGLSGSSVKLLLTAQKDVMKDFVDRKKGGKGTLSQEEHDVLFRAVREGTAQAQNVRMISGSQEMGFGTGWKKFTELSMTPFQFVEQRLNREPAVLAAYRAFKKTAPGEFDAAAYKQAEEFVNNTHYVMGKENLPEIVRKLGPLGKTAYLFQGYVHNYLHWMFNRAKNGEFEAIARSLGAVAALGGVFALPGADDLDKWIMKWFGVSYKMKFKKFVRDNTGNSPAGQMIQNFVNHGVTSVAGVDMSRALAINIPFVSDPDRTFGERMGGAWGGLLKKPGMALSAAQKGDYLRAVENMMPEFAANPMRALRQYDQGATTLSGKPIFDETGHQVKYDGIDVAKKMLGFNPLEISDRTALKGNERDLNAYWKSERDDVLANLRRAKTSEDMKAAVRGVIKYNTELRKSQAFGLVPIIKAESIQKVRTFKPQKKTLSWERNQLDSGNN